MILEDGTSYFLYESPSVPGAIAGAVQGKLITTGMTGIPCCEIFAAPDAKDFGLETQAVYSPTVYVTPNGSSIDATVTYSKSLTKKFSLAYDATYETPVSLAQAAGNYAGYAGSSMGRQATSFVLTSTGELSGTVSGCDFKGTGTPHKQVNVLDLSVTFQGGGCIFGTSTLKGVAYYDAATQRLFAAAPNAARSDGFIVLASKR